MFICWNWGTARWHNSELSYATFTLHDFKHQPLVLFRLYVLLSVKSGVWKSFRCSQDMTLYVNDPQQEVTLYMSWTTVSPSDSIRSPRFVTNKHGRSGTGNDTNNTQNRNRFRKNCAPATVKVDLAPFLGSKHFLKPLCCCRCFFQWPQPMACSHWLIVTLDITGCRVGQQLQIFI